MSQLTEAIFDGYGPFVIPLLVKFVGVQAAPQKPDLIAEFLFEDGSTVLVPIEIQAALAFADVARTLPAAFAVQAKGPPKS